MLLSRTIKGLLFGLILSLSDVGVMSTMKNITLKTISMKWMLLITLIYAIQPWIFLKGLQYTEMATLNLSWDMFSDILVTAVGLYYFREQLSGNKMLGVGFAIVAIFLFAYDGFSKKST
jgi:multidrug transporter EmrE-like cation transporter